MLDPRHGGPSTVAVQFHGCVAAAAYDNLLAGISAETSDDDLIGGVGGQRAAVVSAKMRRDRFDGTRSFNTKRGHRAAAGRSKLNDAERRRRIRHISRQRAK